MSFLSHAWYVFGHTTPTAIFICVQVKKIFGTTSGLILPGFANLCDNFQKLSTNLKGLVHSTFVKLLAGLHGQVFTEAVDPIA